MNATPRLCDTCKPYQHQGGLGHDDGTMSLLALRASSCVFSVMRTRCATLN
jgi:hypothetical protein